MCCKRAANFLLVLGDGLVRSNGEMLTPTGAFGFLVSSSKVTATKFQECLQLQGLRDEVVTRSTFTKILPFSGNNG